MREAEEDKMTTSLTKEELLRKLRTLEHESGLREKAEKKLDQYEMILSTVKDPMSFVDRNYIYRAVNDAYVKVFRRPREEIIGHSVADLLGRDVFERKVRKYFDACLSGEEVHYEDWFEYPSWGRRYVIMSYYPFYENGGSVAGIAVTASDITEHRLTEDALRKYELIISTVNDPMSFLDRNYTYRAVNDAYVKIFQRPREEIIGRTIEDLLGRDVFEEKIRKHVDRCLSGEEVHYEEWFEYPLWGKRYVIMNYYPFYEDDRTITGIAVSASDITAHRRTEESLMKTTMELLLRNEIDRIFLTVEDEDGIREILGIVLDALKISCGIFGHLDHRGEIVQHSMMWDEVQGLRSVDRAVPIPRELWENIWTSSLTKPPPFVVAIPVVAPENCEPVPECAECEIVPVVYQARAIGAFVIAPGPRGLGEKDRRLLGSIANHIAPILNARLQRNQEEEERKKAQEELRKTNDELEEAVVARTADLVAANKLLMQEIEERTRIQKALVQSKEMLGAQYRGFPMPTLTLKRTAGDFILVDFNIAAEKATRGQIGGYVGKGSAVLLGSCSPIVQDIKRCYRTKSIVQKELLSRWFVTEEERYIHLTCSYVPPDMVMVHMEDITERKMAEIALKESEESLRTLSAKLFDAKEEERKHISRELHDGIGQYLTSIKFITESTISRLEKGPCAAEMEPLRTSVPIIRTVIDEVRKMSMNLRPSTLDDFGICVTIDWFCREFQQIYDNIRLTVDIDVAESEVPDELKIIIFRILQEALNNVSTHSRADSATVDLARTGKGLGLIIRDNGIGFNIRSRKIAQRTNRGLGLVSMKERTELYGGTFRIRSSARSGTTVHAFWPDKKLKNG